MAVDRPKTRVDVGNNMTPNPQTARRRLAARATEDRNRVVAADSMDAHDWQARNAPEGEFAEVAVSTKAGDKTRRRRKPTIEDMVDRGRLTGLHLQAAEEIRTVYTAIGRGLHPSRTEGGAKVSGNQHRDPLDRMTKTEENIWRNHYKPWAGEMGIVKTCGGTMLSIAYMIVIDGATLSEAEDTFGMPEKKGYASRALKYALDEYAKIAGWV